MTEHPRADRLRAEHRVSRRSYLTIRLVMQGKNVFDAIEAVSSVAMANPEWDMDEVRTWAEWERES